MKKFNHINIDLPKIEQINLPSGERYYRIPDCNCQYASITTILSKTKKDDFKRWEESLGKEKAEKEKNFAAKRGTFVHDYVEKYLNNENVDNGDFLYLFNQIKPYLNKIDNIYLTEKGLFSHKLKIAGTVDCIAEYEGDLSVIDFKTSTNTKTKEMIDNYFKQCTAYAISFFELTGIAITDIVIIMAVEKGFPMIFKETINNWIEPLIKDINNFYLEKNDNEHKNII